MSLLVIGSVALDTVTTPFGEMVEGLGGSATHFSVSASYFTPVNLVAIVGDDFPREHIDFLVSRKINIEGLQRVAGKTFRWSGHYDYDLSNAQTKKTELNVLEIFNPVIPQALRKPKILFLANIDPDLQMKVIREVERPRLIALDTMNFWIEGKRNSLGRVLECVDLITINEGEARLLSGEGNLRRAANRIQAMGPKTVIIKRGEYGALLFHAGDLFSAPGLPLEDIKDPTGAGDSFAGGFIGYLAKVDELNISHLKQAVIFGSVMASFNVEAFSCDRLRNLTKEEIHLRYKAFKTLTHFDEIE